MEADFKTLFDSALAEAGVELQQHTGEIAQYAAERTAVLATLVGLAGFDQAVIAERDNVMMRAGLASVAIAEETKQRLIGLVQGALFMGARVIAGGGVA